MAVSMVMTAVLTLSGASVTWRGKWIINTVLSSLSKA